MRALYLGLAALFCVLALVVNLTDASRILAVVSLVVGGIFLVLGLRATAEQRVPGTVSLDDKQKETIRTMLAEGRDSTAISQVQLWVRGITPERAREVVEDLRRTDQ